MIVLARERVNLHMRQVHSHKNTRIAYAPEPEVQPLLHTLCPAVSRSDPLSTLPKCPAEVCPNCTEVAMLQSVFSVERAP